MRKFALMAAVVAFGLVIPTLRAEEKKAAGPGVGGAAPAFTLTDQGGKAVSLSDLKGKVVVLEWYNPECPFWLRHYKAGTYNALADKYKEKGVVWLAVDSTASHGQEWVKKWAGENKVSYSVLDDKSGEVGKAYGAKTTPHMFVIDKEGKVAYKGAIDNDPQGKGGDAVTNYVDKALGELVEGKSVSTAETQPYGCSVKYAK